MIKFRKKILAVIVFMLTGYLIGFSYGQSNGNIKDYIIRYERLNFKFNDSIYKATVFVEPNGYFYFRDGFVESSNPKEVSVRRINDKAKTFDYKDSFVLKYDRISQIKNLFPLLYKGDSSISNHYSYDYKPMDYFYNLHYSYILTNLEESSLCESSDKEIIRIIEPEETSGDMRDYSVMALDLKRKKFYYKKGKFDSNADYKIIKNDSISVSDKQMGKVKSVIDQADFRSVKYFTEIGIDVYPKYLIEFCDSDDHFVFEKQIFSRNKQDRKFNELLSMFWSIKANMKNK